MVHLYIEGREVLAKGFININKTIQLIIPLEFVQYFHKVFLSKILLNSSVTMHSFIQQKLIEYQGFQFAF